MPMINEQPRFPTPAGSVLAGRPRTPDPLVMMQDTVHGRYLGGVAIVAPPPGNSPSPDPAGTAAAQLTVARVMTAAPPNMATVMGALGRNPPDTMQPVRTAARR